MGDHFKVDTHVFRELGELLVGRDSTALIELIKNSYDADATEVAVYGFGLSDGERGYIQITDNGTGMSDEDFRKGFLTIASRTKEEGSRRSLRFERRYTGAKGIGRLAAHKLAEVIRVDSNPGVELRRTKGVSAQIDWKKVETYETLDDLAQNDTDGAIIVKAKPIRKTESSGTVIRLERLRRAWTNTELVRFVSEVQSFSPPLFLIKPDESLVAPAKFLIPEPRVADYKKTAPFRPLLEGDFATGDDYWQVLASSADWFVEIDGVTDPKALLYQLTPTRQFTSRFPDALVQKHRLERKEHGLLNAPRFQARLLVREGNQGGGGLKTWASVNSGIRVFMEGFRVLPYGERANDWLELDRSYAERSRTSEYLSSFGLSISDRSDDKDALLLSLPNRSYYGCVFLTQEGAPALQMLVNREGFVPNEALTQLTRLVRLGIDLTVRARAASKVSSRLRTPVATQTSEPENLEATVRALASVRGYIAKNDLRSATVLLERTETSIDNLRETIETETSILRILASVGSQMSAFVHEINAALGMAEGLETAMDRIIESEPSGTRRRELNRQRKAIADLRRQLERQASYLIDINSPDARRRRSRTQIAGRFDAANRLLARVAENRGIKIRNDIPEDLKSPAMFPAELTSIFTNLLTNAIKASGDHGQIRATAKALSAGGSVVRIENSGARIDLATSERWFNAFESTTSTVDSVLGQGMGLGLTITRNMLEQYGAKIRFAKPNSGFATAVEVEFPK